MENAKIVVTITLDPISGNIQVQGPLHNAVLMLGMLELAKMGMKPGTPEPPPKVIIPTPMIGPVKS